METTIERIEREAEKYSLDHQYVFAKRYWSDGAKSERNTTIDEVIELIKSDESKFTRSMDQYNAWCNFIVDLEQLKLKL